MGPTPAVEREGIKTERKQGQAPQRDTGIIDANGERPPLSREPLGH